MTGCNINGVGAYWSISTFLFT